MTLRPAFAPIDLFSAACAGYKSSSLQELRLESPTSVQNLTLLLCAGEQLRKQADLQATCFLEAIEQAGHVAIRGLKPSDSDAILKVFWKRYSTLFRRLLDSCYLQQATSPLLRFLSRAGLEPGLWSILKPICTGAWPLSLTGTVFSLPLDPASKPAAALLAACLRTVQCSSDTIQLAITFHRQAPLTPLGLAFLLACELHQPTPGWLTTVLERITSCKLARIYTEGLRMLIDRTQSCTEIVPVFAKILECVQRGKQTFTSEMLTSLYMSAREQQVAGLFDPAFLPQGPNTLELLLTSSSLDQLNLDSWVPALSVAQHEPSIYTKVTQLCTTLIDSTNSAACTHLISLCTNLPTECRWIRLYALRALLLDFEAKCWITKQADPRKGTALVMSTAKELWGDVEADSEKLMLLLPVQNFRLSYKGDQAFLETMLKDLSEVLERRKLADLVSLCEREALFADPKLSARLQKQAKKELEDWPRGRKLSQSASLYEQLTALLCYDLLRLLPSPLPLFLTLLLDHSLPLPAQELCRDGVLTAAKKLDLRAKSAVSRTTLNAVLQLAGSEDSVDQAVARELLGWTELAPKASRPFRSEDSILDQIPVSNLEALELLMTEFQRRQEDDLSVCLLCEFIWRGATLHPKVLEETLAVVVLRLWDRPGLQRILDFVGECTRALQVVDCNKEQWTGWLKKKGRSAILNATRTRRRQRIPCGFPLVEELQAARNLPESAPTKQCAKLLQQFITKSSGSASDLLSRIRSLDTVSQVSLWLRLLNLGTLVERGDEVFAELKVLWLDVLSQTNSPPLQPSNHLLFLPTDQTSQPAPVLLEHFIHFLQESQSSRPLLSLAAFPFKAKRWLPANSLFTLYVVVMQGALTHKENVGVYVEQLLRFYAESHTLGSLEVKADVISAALRLTAEAARLHPQGNCCVEKHTDLNSALQVLQVLLSEDHQLLTPQAPPSDPQLFKFPEQLLTAAWSLSPRLALRMWRQCAYVFKGRTSALNSVLLKLANECRDSSVFGLVDAEEALGPGICYVKPPSIPVLLQLMRSSKREAASYAHRHLLRAREEAWLFYLPQILQLAAGQSEAVALLSDIVRKSKTVHQQTQWLLQALETSQVTRLRSELRLEAPPNLSYFHRLAEVSMSLVPKDPGNPSFLVAKVSATQQHLCDFPLNPALQVLGAEAEACRPLRSAKRVPIYVPLRCQNKATGEVSRRPVIIKINDDTRNDQLTLQFMGLAKSIFDSHGVDCYLRPYQILPLNLRRAEGEVLGCLMEVVPDCKSRDELWTEGFETLQGFLAAQKGDPASLRKALQASMAGYSLACYLLQIKDRHNGNLLFDTKGHIIHIDFGFILALSPGGNAGVENVEFKLTREMMDAMEDMEAFRARFIRGFMVLREYVRELTAVFELMQSSGSACFTPGAVTELQGRFWSNKARTKVVAGLEQMVYWAQDSMYTRMYDNMQKASQNIQC